SKNRCKDALSHGWWAPIQALAARRLGEAETRLEELTENFREIQAGLGHRERISQARATKICPTCQCTLDDAQILALEDSIPAVPGDVSLSAADLGELARTVTHLRPFADQGPVRAIVSADREYRLLGIELRRKRRKLEENRETLREDEEAEIRSLEHEY